MHRHRFPQMRRRPSHVRCVYITQYALARSLARHCQPDSNCLHAQQNPRVLSHHTHSIAAECALAGATMHIIHSVSRIYTDRRRMTFTFLLRWPSSCLNPILMRTDDVVDVTLLFWQFAGFSSTISTTVQTTIFRLRTMIIQICLLSIFLVLCTSDSQAWALYTSANYHNQTYIPNWNYAR